MVDLPNSSHRTSHRGNSNPGVVEEVLQEHGSVLLSMLLHVQEG